MQRSGSPIWSAKPHTIAKINILKYYLFAWFQIFGRARNPRGLLYIDGFAGPGHYTNHSEGSPVAALVAAREVLASNGPSWTGGPIHCVFIESDPPVADYLRDHLRPFVDTPNIRLQVITKSFVHGIAQLSTDMPSFFRGSQPLFVFIDPFGPTGAPFATVRDILASSRSEVLIHFDADGIARIRRAGADANDEVVLDEIFGDESWRDVLVPNLSPRELTLRAVAHYKSKLRSLPNVSYIFSFEMLTSTRTVGQQGYFLIFASQHPRGLEKMKEAMRRIDQAGDYRFSNARVGRITFFRYDNPEDFSPQLAAHFVDHRVSLEDVRDYTLNETPFVTPNRMLKLLEQQGIIKVGSSDPKRRKGTFKVGTITHIDFVGGPSDG